VKWQQWIREYIARWRTFFYMFDAALACIVPFKFGCAKPCKLVFPAATVAFNISSVWTFGLKMW